MSLAVAFSAPAAGARATAQASRLAPAARRARAQARLRGQSVLDQLQEQLRDHQGSWGRLVALRTLTVTGLGLAARRPARHRRGASCGLAGIGAGAPRQPVPRAPGLRRRASLAASATAQRLLEEAPAIAASFAAPAFEPARYATNAHVMTILGAEVLFRYGPDALPEGLDLRRRRFDTPDADFFDVDFLPCDPTAVSQEALSSGQPPRPLVVLLHGLETVSRAPLFCRMARSFRRRGFDVAMLYFRSCSGELNRTAGSYNCGFTDDLDQLCRLLHSSLPERRLYLAGYSMGGNVVCRYLGQLGADAPARGIFGGAVCNVPFFPEACVTELERGIGKWLYGANFLRKLVPKLEAKAAMLESRGEPVPFDLRAVRSCTTLGEFDDAYIAPIYGFRDRWDYYARQGSGRLLKEVRVPLFAINARDDPFIDRSSLPSQSDVSSTVSLHYPERGGHCGFIAGNVAKLDGGDGRNFLPMVLGDFVDHVERSLNSP